MQLLMMMCADDAPIIQALVQLAKAPEAEGEAAGNGGQRQALLELQEAVAYALPPSNYGNGQFVISPSDKLST